MPGSTTSEAKDHHRELKRIWRLVIGVFIFLVATLIALAALQQWASSTSNEAMFGVLTPFQCDKPFVLLCVGPDPRSFKQGVLVPSLTLNSIGERVVTLTNNPANRWFYANHQLQHVETGLYLAISPNENSVICLSVPDPKIIVALFSSANACLCKINEFVLDFEEVANSNEEVRGVASRRFQPSPNLSIALI